MFFFNIVDNMHIFIILIAVLTVYDLLNWDQISIAQQSIHNPDYLPGVQYLICVDIIQYEVQVDTDQDSYTYMEQRNQTHGQYDTAVVDGDMLYPRYNTELHPFYNLHLNELKELLQ